MLMFMPIVLNGQTNERVYNVLTVKEDYREPNRIVIIGPEVYPILSVEESDTDTRVNILGSRIESKNYNTDTVTRIYLGNKRLEIIDDYSGDTRIRVVHTKQEKFTGHWGGFSLGFNNFGSNYFTSELPQGYDFLDLYTAKSIEVGFNLLQKNIAITKNIGIVTGLGITLNNFRFNSETMRLGRDKNNRNAIGIDISPRFADKNKLLVQYITVPLLFEFQMPDSKNRMFYINAGVYGSFKFSSHVKIRYGDDASPYKEKFRKDFNINTFKYGTMVRVGYRFINLYATCDMSRLFQKGKGPELYPWSIGIMLVSWGNNPSGIKSCDSNF
jgi:hypothetical protein